MGYHADRESGVNCPGCVLCQRGSLELERTTDVFRNGNHRTVLSLLIKHSETMEICGSWLLFCSVEVYIYANI